MKMENISIFFFNNLFSLPPSPPPAMVVAGRAYYDSLAKIGDISADSPVSKELGKWNLTFKNYFKI